MSEMRSLALGDCDHYASPYLRGVKQAIPRFGGTHVEVSIRQPAAVIAQRIADVRPDIIWTHMLLWAPNGSPPVEELVEIMVRARRAGAKIVLHDGDYKERCRHPHDLRAWCSLALVNHAFDRSAWRVPLLHWPYFAMAQDRIARPDPALACELWFAGRLDASETYSDRARLVSEIRRLGVALRTPAPGDNTLDRTDVIAASARAVLGFGRPTARGWVDTRVFQYPGAGGILVHDHVAGYIEPMKHYIPYRSGDASSMVEALGRLRAMGEVEQQRLRERAFTFVQAHHSSVARVRQVLHELEIPCRA